MRATQQRTSDNDHHTPTERPSRAERRAARRTKPTRVVRPGFEGTPVEAVRAARLASLRAAGASIRDRAPGEIDALGWNGTDPRRARQGSR